MEMLLALDPLIALMNSFITFRNMIFELQQPVLENIL